MITRLLHFCDHSSGSVSPCHLRLLVGKGSIKVVTVAAGLEFPRYLRCDSSSMCVRPQPPKIPRLGRG